MKCALLSKDDIQNFYEPVKSYMFLHDQYGLLTWVINLKYDLS